MAISRFDEIPNLVCYYSGHESTISKTGTSVDSIAPVQGGNAPTLLAAGDNKVQHDPAQFRIGQLNALFTDATTDARLIADFPTQLAAGTPLTAVLVTEAADISRDGWPFEVKSTNGTNMFGQRNINGSVTIMVNNSSRNSLIPRSLGPEIYVGLWDYADGAEQSRCEVYVNNQENTILSAASPQTNNVRNVTLCNRFSGSTPFGGMLGIFALYSRALEAQEIADVKTLCQYWIDNGRAPDPGPEKPTTGEFNATMAGGSISGYECRRDNVGDGVWYDVNDATNGLSNATVAGGKLTINSAAITDNADIRAIGSVPNGPSYVPSAVSRLTVES